MADLLEQLAEAAARGVDVTIITNDHPAPSLRFKWTHEQRWWGAVSTFKGAGLSLRVVDRDGDQSEWSLSEGRTIIAEGSTHECDPYYHFDACLLAAEAALLAEVRRRRAALGKGRADG